MFFSHLRRRVGIGLSIVLIGCTATTSIVSAQKGRDKVRERAIKGLKFEIRKRLRNRRYSKKIRKISKEEIDNICEIESKEILSGIKNKIILKRIISDKNYRSDLLSMAVIDVKKQDEKFCLSSTKNLYKTRFGFNILTEDRLELREILIKKVQNSISKVDRLLEIELGTIETLMNKFVWTFSDDFCGEIIKDECILGEIADTFIENYDAELIVVDKKNKLEREEFKAKVSKLLDAIASEGNVSENDNKDVYFDTL